MGHKAIAIVKHRDGADGAIGTGALLVAANAFDRVGHLRLDHLNTTAGDSAVTKEKNNGMD